MKGLKLSIITFLFLFLAVFNIAFSMPVVDILQTGLKSLDQLVDKAGLHSSSEGAKQVKSSLELTIRALNNGKYPKTSKELKSVLSFDSRLIDIINKDVNEFTDKDLAKLVNRLSVRAEKKSRGPFMMCGACVSDELSEFGIVSISQRVSKSTSQILKSVPSTPSKLNRAIRRAGSVLEIKNISEINNSIPDVDKRRFYVALSKMKSGTKSEKALGQALIEFSSAGDSSLLHKSRLYTLLTDRLPASDMKSWTKTLETLAAEEPIDSDLGRVVNLERWFEKKAKDSPEMKDSLEKLRKKNCWKIFH